ncbi:hypothetical protein QCA50_019073 [Cerrena zonata]|uniref:Uncharacterized protein n=1 Tax=Cerrena zonata TaxID=2478898 RepID=A0AAW0FCA0_9APHY
MYYLSLLLNLAQKDSTDANTPAALKFSNVFNSVKSYVPSLQAPATQETKPVPESNVEDEYDVIDKPNDDSKKSSASTSGAEVKRDLYL